MDQQSAGCRGLSDVTGRPSVCCMLLAHTLGLIVTLASNNTVPHHCLVASVGSPSSPPRYRVLLCARIMAVVSDYSCDLPWFNYYWTLIAKFSNQMANQVAVFQIESLHFKSNCQNGSNHDLNPNCNSDLPITAICPDKYNVILFFKK